MDKKKLFFIAAFLNVFILSVVLMWYFFADFTFETTDLNTYKSTGKVIDQYADSVMPDLNTLLVYDKIQYKLKSDDLHAHHKYVEYLNVVYDSDTYLMAVRSVNQSYKFLNHVVVSPKGDGYLMPQYQFRINNYKFQVVNVDKSGLSAYPKYFGVIATNDALCSITYMYFYNEELETIRCAQEDISETLPEFIRNNCDFDFGKD